MAAAISMVVTIDMDGLQRIALSSRDDPPLKMAQVGHKELMRVMTAAGYTVETEGFPKG